MLSAQFASPRSRIACVALPAEGLDDWRPVLRIVVRIASQLAVLDQVRHQRVQPVDRDELLREVERRAEVIDAAVDVVRIGETPGHRRCGTSWLLPSPKMPGPGREDRIPLRGGLARPSRLAETASTIRSSAPFDELAVPEEAGPVGVHAEVQRLVVEKLRRPLDGVDLGDLRRDDEPRDLEELVGRDVPVADDARRVGRDCEDRSRRRASRAACARNSSTKSCARARTGCGRSSSRSSSCRGTPVASWPAHCGQRSDPPASSSRQIPLPLARARPLADR